MPALGDWPGSPELPQRRPLPWIGSVVIEVVKIVDIDQPRSVIVDHVELVVPVLARRPPSRSHSPVPTGTRSHLETGTRASSDDLGTKDVPASGNRQHRPKDAAGRGVTRRSRPPR